jgi:hypothetical protein
MYPVKKPILTCGFHAKGSQWQSGYHQGYDFAGRQGTPVYAMADGVVIGVNIWGRAFGRFAPVIKHGKVYPKYVVYGHVRAVFVKPGDKVKRGQKIAEIGVEGNSGGPHIHVEGQRTKWWTPTGGTRLTSLFRA